jgi:hypothetical protein
MFYPLGLRISKYTTKEIDGVEIEYLTINNGEEDYIVFAFISEEKQKEVILDLSEKIQKRFFPIGKIAPEAHYKTKAKITDNYIQAIGIWLESFFRVIRS